MERKRAEPFPIVLQTLRKRLREGAFAVEQRLAAADIAAELNLSATPVREALARLAGEGLLEDRRGQGYFVRRLSGLDVADLLRLSESCLAIALQPRGVQRAGAEEAGAGLGELAAADPLETVRRVERLFEGWVAEGAGWALAEQFRRTQARLGPVRRIEPWLIPDLAEEASALARAAAEDERMGAVRAFHRRRLKLADRLAVLLERRASSPADPAI